MSDWKCVREAGGICEWHRFDGYMFRIFEDGGYWFFIDYASRFQLTDVYCLSDAKRKARSFMGW